MNKKILALAIAAVTLMASSASARENRCANNGNDCKIEKCEKNVCKKDNCKKENCKKQACKKDNCKQNVCKPGTRDCKKKCNPFEGLNLSQEQQTRIAAIPTPRQVMKAAVEKGDVKRENVREYVRTVRADYLNNVKQVLNADQYNKFLENFYVNAAPNKNKKDGKFNKRQGKQQKQFDKNKQYRNKKNNNSK